MKGLSDLEGPPLVEKGHSVSPAFLVLDLSGKSVEAVTSADREVLPCPSDTIFLDRRNGESCSFPTKVPCCGHQSFLWQFFFLKCQGDSLPQRAVWKKTPAWEELSLHLGSSRAKSLFFMKSHRKPPCALAREEKPFLSFRLYPFFTHGQSLAWKWVWDLKNCCKTLLSFMWTELRCPDSRLGTVKVFSAPAKNRY